jgi:alpha-glucosidase
MKEKYILTLIISFLISYISFAQISEKKILQSCESVEVEGHKAVFKCNDSIQVMLQQLSPGIISVWMENGQFQRNNESFAVLSEEIDLPEKLNLAELSGSYEIYTGELIIRVIKSPFQIRFYDKYQKLLLETLAEGFVSENESKQVSMMLRPEEAIYGLGEKGGSLNRRGKSFRMWNSDKPCYAPDEDPLYKSIPFFMSNFGYGIFFDNTYKTSFDFGEKQADRLSFGAPGGEMYFYFIFGPSYKQIIGRYSELTGKPIMPPNWAFGFSQSRGLYTKEMQAREVADEFRKRKIPCDIIYQDIGWTQYLQDFEWRKNNYQNPAAMLNDLAENGFKMIVSQDPVISQANVKQWKEADSLGYFTKDTRTEKSYDMPWPWGGNCGIVDFTIPEVADWWGDYQQKPVSIGVKGFWTDMGEPAWSNEEDVDRLFMKHHLGMHDEIHNVYGLTWDKVVTEQFEKHNPNQRIFQMTRAAYAGLQRYTFGWSGDAGSGHNVNKGWSSLAGQIPMALSAGMGLIPFWATDISGYCGDIQDYAAFSELYIRWMQFGLFNPLSRAHHEGDNAVEPWVFGPEVEKIVRENIELKYKLHPYFYSYAREAWETGLPLMRAMLIGYPEDKEAAKAEHQFMLGAEMLVAPVVEENATTKEVYLPQGEWIDYHNKQSIYKGKRWIEVDAPLHQIPVFVKKGAVIPTMPVMQYIGEKKDYPVTLEIFPPSEGRTSSFVLYEDDGTSNDYKLDVFRKTSITAKSNASSLAIHLSSHYSNGYPITAERNFALKIHIPAKAKAVSLNGKKLLSRKTSKNEQILDEMQHKAFWTWDEKENVCLIVLKDDVLRQEISVIY